MARRCSSRKLPELKNIRGEISKDNGATWQPVGETDRESFELTKLENETKAHVRVIALNSERQSRPANEYPVYVSAKPPQPPDGLRIQLAENQVKALWGEVLGVSEYRLYRREKGQSSWTQIFHGLANKFLDRGVKAVPAFSEPGLEAAVRENPSHLSHPIYEYAASAVNGNGEGEKCVPTDTDPASWRNWTSGLRSSFQAPVRFLAPAVRAGGKSTPPYYPQ